MSNPVASIAGVSSTNVWFLVRTSFAVIEMARSAINVAY